MAFKKLSALVGVSALAGFLMTSQTAFAYVNPAHGEHHTYGHAYAHGQTLVALGDSITFGMYLPSPSLTNPSPDAFPSVIGHDEHLKVTNLGTPGWTSQDLLSSLTADEIFRNSVRHAKVVTIDIGSNDLLSIASQDGILTSPSPTITPAEQQQFAAAIQQFSHNLPAIVREVRELSPGAKIVLYNLYNPIPSAAPQLFALGQKLIGSENAIIAQNANHFRLPVADAFTAFAGHDATYIIPGNVHPSILGQEVLASVGEQVLAEEHFHGGHRGNGNGHGHDHGR